MLQIDCSRYKCYKAVEVCYWSCKFRPKCKDWQKALDETPGIEAVNERLFAASKKSGRSFELLTLTPSAKSKQRMRRAPEKPIQINEKGALHKSMFDTVDEIVEETMESKNDSSEGNSSENGSANGDKKAKAKAAKPAKPKPAKAKQDNTVNTEGPIFLLLYPNGKYKELSESELQLEAASVVKDATLRLIKGQFLVPMISFKSLD